MQFTSPLLRGTLIKRYKRFLADIELENGQVITAHCPNTGAMTGCAEPGYIAYVSESKDPKRKLKYTWELAQDHNQQWIGINTHRANALVAEAIENQSLDIFKGWSNVKREQTPPGGQSRFDFSLVNDQGIPSYLEVKSVTLARHHQGFFPDAVTTRGQKHAQELQHLAQNGVSTYLLFCVQHSAIQTVSLAKDIDPKYAHYVNMAQQAGVKVMAVGCAINKQKIEINQSLPVFI